MKGWLLKHITLRAPDSAAEELASGITHLLGAALSAVGMAFLVSRMVTGSGPLEALGAVVYGLSMVVLYSASSAYHLTSDPVWKRLFRVLDHVAIYLLIAGTYTPVALAIGGRLGWGLFAAIWALAALGIAFTFRFWGRYRALHVALYVAAGWTVVVAWRPVMERFPTELFGWALAGGVTYTLGAVVYMLKRLPFHHALWHLFVLGGSVCFFVGIYRNILLI